MVGWEAMNSRFPDKEMHCFTLSYSERFVKSVFTFVERDHWRQAPPGKGSNLTVDSGRGLAPF